MQPTSVRRTMGDLSITLLPNIIASKVTRQHVHKLEYLLCYSSFSFAGTFPLVCTHQKIDRLSTFPLQIWHKPLL